MVDSLYTFELDSRSPDDAFSTDGPDGGRFKYNVSTDLVFDPNQWYISFRYFLVKHHAKLGSGRHFDVLAIN